MGPLRGWAPVGQPLVGPEATYSAGKRVSLIAALDLKGIRSFSVVDGGVKGDDFDIFIQSTLGKTALPEKEWVGFEVGEGGIRL